MIIPTDELEPIRLEPITTTLHLDFVAGEPATIEIEVTDDNDTPVPLRSATATVALPGGCDPLHVWTGDTLVLANQTARPGVLWLHSTASDTVAWVSWGDAHWQLDVIDLFDRPRRPCRGRVRVRSGLRPGEGNGCCP